MSGGDARASEEQAEKNAEKKGSAPWLWSGLGALAFAGVVMVTFGGASSPGHVAPASAPSAASVGAALPSGARGAPSEAARASLPGLDAGSPDLPILPDAGFPLSPNVRITFQVVPPRRATVRWGKERLGVIPARDTLVIERPRDSGPLDVVIRSPGYLTVHTRAYTFDHSTVDVRLTPRDQKEKLYGYRQPLPPPDAGVPLLEP